MSIIISDEIRKTICDELRSAKESVQIITAYCKLSALSNLFSCVDENVQSKRLMVRFRLDDLMQGSTDFDVLSYAMNKDWDVYIRFDLHAKTYIVDNKRGIIGSANTTARGLSFNQISNLEMATIADIDSKDIDKINCIFADSIKVDRTLIDELYEQYNKTKGSDFSKVKYAWNENIIKRFTPHINTLFSHDFPDKGKYELLDYIPFVDSVYENDNQLKLLIMDSNAYRWLIQTVKESNGEIFFGPLSAKLHDSLVSDPKPYRKDVKEMLSNFLSLIELLKLDKVCIDRPNYSQRIRVIE